MKVDKQKLKSLLDGNSTYVMPLFQRGYVWGDDNWQTLWDDVVRTTHEVSEKPTVQHFIGAIVLEQLPTAAGRMPQHQVIDGQQRLTTIQIMLKALHDVLGEHGEAESQRGDIPKYLFNSGAKIKTQSDEFKVWPTNVDRQHFVRVMKDQMEGAQEHRFSAAYKFFKDSISAWLEDGANEFDSIETAVETMVYVVEEALVLAEIDLEGDDDSQEIFETLNALGTPLRPSDLIKNHLFRLAQDRGMDLDSLYEDYWKDLEHDSKFWQSERTVGRFTRTEIDIFLQYWVSVQLQRDVTADVVFRSFRELLADAQPEQIRNTFDSIVRYSRLYRRFQNKEGDERENRFARRLDEMETYAVYPLVLFFYDHVQDVAERHQMLEIIESFLVRRMLMRWSTKSYSRAGTDTMHALWRNQAVNAAALQERLRQYEAAGTRWPTDEELTVALSQNGLYGTVRQSRLAMVLLAVNERMHQERSEIVDVQGNLQIEHIMPQSWKDHWPLPPGNEVEKSQQREALINTVGNLTVITGKLNQSVSNGAWDVKRSGLDTFSNLVINRELVHEPEWNEDKIARRSERIARYICEIWPR